MFTSVLELFKIGVGPSSSHTIGPMLAARAFVQRIPALLQEFPDLTAARVRCTLKGSLSYTGRGHATDRAVLLGLHGYTPDAVAMRDVDALVTRLLALDTIATASGAAIAFSPATDTVFDPGPPLPAHPNGMIFELLDDNAGSCYSQTCFSIGGGFISTAEELAQATEAAGATHRDAVPYPFTSATEMLAMAASAGTSIAGIKRANELVRHGESALDVGLQTIRDAMQRCIDNGLTATGELPGGLGLQRRAKSLAAQATDMNDWLCAYAMAVNEENAAGHMVVTAPTNGAAGVIPAVLSYYMGQGGGSEAQVAEFLLTAAAIGGIIKHRSSISGAEVGCQGEVGSASAMAAAALCAVRGGTPSQVENAAEIALEHHLGMTCDPVNGLVQVPCIERNGFGAIKAWAAASLALHGSGEHFMPLDNCIAAMQQTGAEMSEKFKETAKGGLAVNLTEC